MTHQESMIERAIAKHNGYYSYPVDQTFSKTSDKMTIVCPIHGQFDQIVNEHINKGRGCRHSAHRKDAYTTESWIKHASSIERHKGKYDYSSVVYMGAFTKVKLYCKSCQEHFEITPNAHTSGEQQGHYKCGLKNRIIPHQKNTEKFVAEAVKIARDRGETYDYSNTVYTNHSVHIEYVCLKHGIQHQTPKQHLRTGCQMCRGRGVTKHTPETFAHRGQEVHGLLYGYDKVELNSVTDRVQIVCNRCGDTFLQIARNHINDDNGCPRCAETASSSRAEQEVADFFVGHEVIRNYRKILDGKEIDIWLPEFKFGVEYHGNWYHSESQLISRGFGKKYHSDKADIAESKGIRLVQIFEHEWRDKREIVISRLGNQLGISKRIYARNTTVSDLSDSEKDIFLRTNHIQGSCRSQVNLGLVSEGEIVACMTFGPPRYSKGNDHELIRYCSRLGTTVVGGAGRLLKHFRDRFPGSLISYADRRWSSGNLYQKLGFEYDGKTSPGYFYYHFNRRQVYHRLKFQKHLLSGMSGYDESLTEYEIMKKNGYDRIWDAGNTRWILK